ncbi:MAG TPA: hypothetical protein VGI39_17350, partial [Polyangiaceae bacterium]
MTRRHLLFLLAGAIALGCDRGDAPVEPVWGKEPCAHCAMILSDRRFGAQLTGRDGDRFFFDDPGCLVSFVEERKLASYRAWVHDAQTGAWLDASSARYARAASPMDFGFEARAAG